MTVANWIVQRIREALFAGRLKSGDFVGTELDIAKRFGVSRIAARDALKTLDAAGIVTIRPGPGGGARIAQANPTRFSEALAIQLKLLALSEKEIYVSQQAIELMATEYAARNATEADLEAIEALLHEAKSLRADPVAFSQSCFAFHAAVTRASHNRVLIALREAIENVIPDAYRGDPNPQQVESILEHHRKVLMFLKDRKPERATEQMRKHMRSLDVWLDKLAARGARAAATGKRRSPAKA
jgi:GntR family transcriptional repressor for pyruvate dehydrogenase complex